ncbi:hypothetical protein [Diatraea saccharalis granulovirus]|uniref:Uncharacterized protein n=1 Tax=Diatraea saccharalis granulovirus TaxID=1675862 RepID=A0A0R7EZ04_9BBAC|nr:hypothetical protein [Diatraea saccharalis granulovirus]AKN80817.1 hypothetical protein [Diatraea saccharalis granulovirus]
MVYTWCDIFQFIFVCCGKQYQYKEKTNEKTPKRVLCVPICSCENHNITINCVRTDGNGFIDYTCLLTKDNFCDFKRLRYDYICWYNKKIVQKRERWNEIMNYCNTTLIHELSDSIEYILIYEEMRCKNRKLHILTKPDDTLDVVNENFDCISTINITNFKIEYNDFTKRNRKMEEIETVKENNFVKEEHKNYFRHLLQTYDENNYYDLHPENIQEDERYNVCRKLESDNIASYKKFNVFLSFFNIPLFETLEREYHEFFINAHIENLREKDIEAVTYRNKVLNEWFLYEKRDMLFLSPYFQEIEKTTFDYFYKWFIKIFKKEKHLMFNKRFVYCSNYSFVDDFLKNNNGTFEFNFVTLNTNDYPVLWDFLRYCETFKGNENYYPNLVYRITKGMNTLRNRYVKTTFFKIIKKGLNHDLETIFENGDTEQDFPYITYITRDEATKKNLWFDIMKCERKEWEMRVARSVKIIEMWWLHVYYKAENIKTLQKVKKHFEYYQKQQHK